jgi:hypothetical protein
MAYLLAAELADVVSDPFLNAWYDRLGLEVCSLASSCSPNEAALSTACAFLASRCGVLRRASPSYAW